MGDNIYIIGAGDFARKAYECAKLLGYEIKAFVVEGEQISTPVSTVRVIPEKIFQDTVIPGSLFVAIGDGIIRKKLNKQYCENGWDEPYLIHPSAIISSDVVIGKGVFFAAGVVIECGCVIGEGTILDVGVIIDHDCRIPPYSHIRSRCTYYPKDFMD